MADALACETCAFFRPVPHTTLGDCDLQVVYGRTPFYYSGCAYHSQFAAVPAQPTVDMQSQARGGPPWPNPGLAQWVKP